MGLYAKSCVTYTIAQYLLIDDMLAAVDSHTAQHLYNTYLKGPLMKGRTCILVTHNVDLCLPGSAFLVQSVSTLTFSSALCSS